MGRAGRPKHLASPAMAVVEILKVHREGAGDTRAIIEAMDRKGYPREVTQAALATLESKNVLRAEPASPGQEKALSEAKEKADRNFVRRVARGGR